jgi:threonyl-tRNA synthetase
MENENKDLKILRHSAAHLLAHAILELYPDTILTIGPATDDGFFYDILPSTNFKEADLAILEERMKDISKRNLDIIHCQITKDEAKRIFKDNRFKLELIDNIDSPYVGLSCQGEFKDLCKSGHVLKTSDIKYFKLLYIAGSYWKADKNNQPLQRIYGTAFYSEKELNDFLRKRDESIKYDHRKIAKELDLFSFCEDAAGFPFFHPKGQTIINRLIDYIKHIHYDYNYMHVSTPTILSDELWKRSGHYSHYKSNMYFTNIDGYSYAIKPMNCPGSMIIYNSKPRSYKELPMKLAEFGHVFRHELSGVLHGLMRVRSFTQDDAHIYCSLDQLEDEVKNIVEIIFKVLEKFQFNNIELAISTKPENAMGSDDIWKIATDTLESVLKNMNKEYTIKDKEGAFYGPKIEVIISDSMDRKWQCSTIQIDFFQPENFNLHYISSDGTKKRPIIIHQAIYGSLERFFAILIEHYKGILPFWLAPIQMEIIPISEKFLDYATKIYNKLREYRFKISLNRNNDPLNAKIKDAQNNKIPWMLILGQKEIDNNSVTLRLNNGTIIPNMDLNELISKAIELNKF